VLTFCLCHVYVYDARRISAAEMKYMRRTTDYKTNTQIAKELK
jgi:hypothetical protein